MTFNFIFPVNLDNESLIKFNFRRSTKSIFESNTSIFKGGALELVGATSTIKSSVFSSNTAKNGGAIDIQNSTFDNVNITNSIFNDNSATTDGAAIFCDSPTLVDFKILNCNILNNTCPVGANTIYVQKSNALILQNSIIQNNINEKIQLGDGSGAIQVINNTLTNTLQFNDPTNITANPLFVNNADPNGTDNLWFTADDGWQLQNNSPCIDAGLTANAPLLDILDSAISGNSKDMGAYEYLCPQVQSPVAAANQSG